MGSTHPRIRGSGEGERWAAPGKGPFLAGPRATWTPVTQQIYPLPMPGPDLDECRVRSLCQHACRNTEGSYQCLCPAGYRLLPSGKNCQGEPGPGRVGDRDAPSPDRPSRAGSRGSVRGQGQSSALQDQARRCGVSLGTLLYLSVLAAGATSASSPQAGPTWLTRAGQGLWCRRPHS